MVRADGCREYVWSSINNSVFFKNNLKWVVDVGGESTKCPKFKAQAEKVGNLRLLVSMVKGGAEVKLFTYMLKKNCLFVSPNLIGNVIAFMGDCPLEVRPWVFKIPCDKPWAWLGVKFLIKYIAIKTHFSQEGNRHAIW